MLLDEISSSVASFKFNRRKMVYKATEISYSLSLDLRLVKLVPVGYCFYPKIEFLNCSVWAVGTIKHLVLFVVSCWTKFDDTKKCLGLMCLLFVFWGRKNVSVGRAGIDPLTVRYIYFCLWSRRLLSNVSRLKLVSMVVTDPGCLER